MIREMRQVKVSLENGEIRISQGNEGHPDDTPSVVYLNPGQIDTIVEWLNEAKEMANSPATAVQR